MEGHGLVWVKTFWKRIEMASKKPLGKKLKLIAVRKRSAPRWADIKKFSLKRARARRIRSITKHWRRSKNKI